MQTSTTSNPDPEKANRYVPWRLHVDDQRWPADGTWFAVKTAQEAIRAVKVYGVPVSINLDYDLLDGTTIEPFVEWLRGEVESGARQLPQGFSYQVISNNPKGAEWLKQTFDELITHYQTEYVLTIDALSFSHYLLQQPVTGFKDALCTYLQSHHDTVAGRKLLAEVTSLDDMQAMHYVQPYIKYG